MPYVHFNCDNGKENDESDENNGNHRNDDSSLMNEDDNEDDKEDDKEDDTDDDKEDDMKMTLTSDQLTTDG